MKRIKFITNIILFVFLMNTTCISAQLVWAKPADFKILKERPLIVQQMELDEKKVTHYKNKIENAKTPNKKKIWTTKLVNYKNFITDFNTYIKATVEKYFDLNPSYIYKTSTEIKNILGSKKNYSVLYYSTTPKTADVSNEYYKESIPVFVYTRCEKKGVKSDYRFNIPYIGYRKNKNLKEMDFRLSFLLMKNHISQIEKLGIRGYSFKKYAIEENKNNHKELGKEKIILNEESIYHKSSLNEINSIYKGGEITSLSEVDFNNIIIKGEYKIVGIIIPYSTFTNEKSQATRIYAMKCFINANSGKIYCTVGAVKAKFSLPAYQAIDFERMNIN